MTGTPFYRYDVGLLRRTLNVLQEITDSDSRCHVHYAIKANSNPLLLKHIKEFGLGIDCVSGGEIKAALDAGFPPSVIVFAGVGKADWEIDLALENGIFCINVESEPELDVIQERARSLGKKAHIALRINPDIDAHTHSNITTGIAENKFGIDLNMLDDILTKATGLENIVVEGLHFHIGSQILDMEPFRMLCGRINDIQEKLKQKGFIARHINVGGGLGVDYIEPDANPVADFKGYFDVFRNNLKLYPNQELHFELGRSIVAQCGQLITRVLYVKRNSLKQFAITDAGMTDLIRPALYGAYHRIDNISNPDGEKQTYDVVGPICESSDTFGKGRELPEIRRGDLLAIKSAGAYGESMASCYNLRTLPRSESFESD